MPNFVKGWKILLTELKQRPQKDATKDSQSTPSVATLEAIEIFTTSQKQIEEILEKILQYQPDAEKSGVQGLKIWRKQLDEAQDIRETIFDNLDTLTKEAGNSEDVLSAQSKARTISSRIISHSIEVTALTQSFYTSFKHHYRRELVECDGYQALCGDGS
ncbi:hypothetical protein L218DRAFT_990366 [Marasmius fiardii PR-910]|nr:hypothetical protein L218DRAFT_990366 [Marasmius fiardii PR-910]